MSLSFTGDVQSKLTSYCPGCKAKSVLLYIKGGPAHLYLKKNKVTTVAKLKKEGAEDMVWFWKTLGGLMSKLEPDTTVIHIMGCNVMGYPKYVGIDLFEYLQELMKPSVVRFEAPLELSITGYAVIESYFDANRYKLWKTHKYSNLDRVFGPRPSTSRFSQVEMKQENSHPSEMSCSHV
ncbi:NMDA receptor synaptonuclear signaling and neuronal migration factor-like [Branchiostoma lanceolatum]|uniref:NMDA receptor synaptonuclear signaling and neuronal migration factor-like n=1 Tax=Branchiostoma lanceolatum TaxID=7740 RepID=UPI00345344F7